MNEKTTTCAGSAPAGAAARGIRAVAASLGYSCQPGEGPVLLWEKEGPGWRRLSLPGAVRWSWVHEEDRRGKLTVHLEFLPSRGQRWLLILLAVLSVLLLIGTVITFEVIPAERQHEIGGLLAGVFLSGLFLATVLGHLLGVLGGGRQASAFWQAVQEGIHQAGGRLEPQGRAVTALYTRASLLFIGLVLVLVAWPVGRGLGRLVTGAPIHEVVILGGAVALLGLIGTMVVLINRDAPAMIRADALLGGLVSQSALLLLLAAPLPMLLDGPEVLKLEQLRLSLSAMQEGGELPPEATIVTEVEVRRWARGLLLLSALLVVSALYLGYRGLMLTFYSWSPTLRLRRKGRRKADREAILDRAALRRFRRVFVSLWALTTPALLCLLGTGLLWGLEAVWPIRDAAWLQVPEISARIFRLALGLSARERALDGLQEWIWLAFGLGCLGVLGVSVGQLLWTRGGRRRALRRLWKEGWDDPSAREWQQILDEMVARAGMKEVRLVVAPGPKLGGFASLFGLFAPERYVVLFRPSLTELSEGQVRALLAHELAHHRRGHCRAGNLLRWLARWSLAGDAFALTVQATAWYEHRADAEAVGNLFGANATDLLQAIHLVHHLGSGRWMGEGSVPSAEGDPGAVPVSPPTSVTLPPGGPAAMPWRRRLRCASKVFLLQYFNATATHYWHPLPAERREYLAAERPTEHRP